MTTSKTDVIIKIKLMLRHKMTSSTPSNLSHFQSIHGGGFFRKERTNRNTTLYLQISHVVLYHWGLTTKKSLAECLATEASDWIKSIDIFSIP